jgi:hypothetical protein
MMNDLLIQFSTDAGERSYGRTVADLIRAEQHKLAEGKLITDLASLSVPLAERNAPDALGAPSDALLAITAHAQVACVLRVERGFGGPAEQPRPPE